MYGWAEKWTEGDPAQYSTIHNVLPVAKALGDGELTAEVLNGLGCSAASLDTCREHLVDGLRHVPASAVVLHVSLLGNLGIVSWALGQPTAALDVLEEAVHRARTAQRPLWVAPHNLATLAFVLADRGALDVAREYVDEAETMTGSLENLDTRIYVATIAGEIDDGLTVLAYVLAHTDRRGDFTCEIVNPQIWEECTASIPLDRLDAARARRESRPRRAHHQCPRTRAARTGQSVLMNQPAHGPVPAA